jgi:hypothetical protein
MLHDMFSPGLLCMLQVRAYMEAALGVQRFAAVSAALTVPPLHTCVRVNTLRATREVCTRCMQPLLGQLVPCQEAYIQACIRTGQAGSDLMHRVGNLSWPANASQSIS